MYWQNKFEYINILKYNIKTKPGGYSCIGTKSDIIERKKEKYLFSILQVFLRSKLYHEPNDNPSVDETDIECVSYLIINTNNDKYEISKLTTYNNI